MDILQNIGLTICGSIFLLFVIIGYIKSKKIKSFESALFLIMLITITISTICEFSFSFMSVNTAKNASILSMLVKIYVFITMLWINSLTIYLLACANKEFFEKNKKYKLIAIIVLAVLTIVPFILKLVLGKIPDVTAANNIGSINAIYGHPTHFCAIPIVLVIICLLSTSLNRVLKTLKIPFFGTLLILISEIIIKLFVHTELNELTFLFQLLTIIIFLTSESANVRMIKQISEAKQKSEIALDGQNEFISSMSHDIRTPLGAIIGMSEVLLNEEGLTLDKTKEELQGVTDASEKLTELITNLIDIAKINDNNLVVDTQVYTISKLSKSVGDMLKIKTDKRNTTLNINVSERMPSTYSGDYGKILRSILLMANAIVCKTNNGNININYSGDVSGEVYKFATEIEITNTSFSIEEFNIDFSSYMSLYTDKINTIDSEKLGIIIAKNYIQFLGGTVNYSTLENGTALCKIVIPVQIGKGE